MTGLWGQRHRSLEWFMSAGSICSSTTNALHSNKNSAKLTDEAFAVLLLVFAIVFVVIAEAECHVTCTSRLASGVGSRYITLTSYIAVDGLIV